MPLRPKDLTKVSLGPEAARAGSRAGVARRSVQRLFLRIDASTLALHVGDGQYVWPDVERDLQGLLPSEAVRQLRPRE